MSNLINNLPYMTCSQLIRLLDVFHMKDKHIYKSSIPIQERKNNISKLITDQLNNITDVKEKQEILLKLYTISYGITDSD